MQIRQLCAGLALAAVALAGCGGSAHPAAKAKPAAPTTAQVISSATKQECARFAVANSRISSDTANDKIVLQLSSTVNANWRTWNRLLGAAAKLPPGVPQDQNAATRTNLAILLAHLDETRLAEDAAVGLRSRRLLTR